MSNLFFTITLKNQETHFSAREYEFTIPDSEQKPGTAPKCLWWYEFDPNPNLDLQWVSWNQNHNATKSWEYLLLKVKDTLYSGFINKSRTQENIHYRELKPLPPRLDEIFA